ncbi:uncharacterized protein LOC121530061 [Drosophila eugracilis]|uniref:uncharacterized protein LOC121530061 n=1 Tax=Drosophila eugracilis TaxID=29029 RepID=UPI001BDB6628|nr:uncharacterized protein LOC121530061 [Drosophila eugracilis]
MGCLSEKRPVSASSPIQNLNPFMDSQGVMRACGRVTSSELLQYVERHPIILPYDCHLSRLLVQFTHRIMLHGGNQLMIRLIRAKFWIPRVRNLVKSDVYACKVCVIHKKKLQAQLMGELPKERTSFSRPFTDTGVDYAGPFEIKNYTGRACLITKGYVLVFVCFSTKAIYVEPKSDVTTEKFLCLQSPAASLAFHSSGSPPHGGLWEAGVKSFKTLFYKSTATRKYTFEELATLLARIEACLNSRPLAPMSEDPVDLMALTPGHFLHLKALQQQFRLRWKKEYLKELHKRNLRVGDMVVIKEDNLPSNEWRLGRIDAVYPGSDSHVRRNSVNVLATALVRIDIGSRIFNTGAVIMDASLAACFLLPTTSVGDEQV